MSPVTVLDSNILIYVLDDASPFSSTALELLKQLEQNQARVFMSSLARTEILARPYAIAQEVGDKARNLLDSFYFLSYVDVSKALADEAAKLTSKAGSKLKNIDSIHLATALTVNAGEFWTNDYALSKVLVEGLTIKLLGNKEATP